MDVTATKMSLPHYVVRHPGIITCISNELDPKILIIENQKNDLG